jgi:hypothetical protein
MRLHTFCIILLDLCLCMIAQSSLSDNRILGFSLNTDQHQGLSGFPLTISIVIFWFLLIPIQHQGFLGFSNACFFAYIIPTPRLSWF